MCAKGVQCDKKSNTEHKYWIKGVKGGKMAKILDYGGCKKKSKYATKNGG